MSLDSAVSLAVAQSVLLERALHSRLLWFIEIGGVRAKAERNEHEHGVTFVACFDSVPVDVETATLIEGHLLRSARPFAYPGEGEFCLRWDLTLRETVGV